MTDRKQTSMTLDNQSKVEPPQEMYLKIYGDRSELALSDATTHTFAEGPMTAEAKARYGRIQKALESGFLREQIILCRQQPDLVGPNDLADRQREQLDELVELLTSESGRALTVLTLIQLCIKAIEPQQSIRLHKGGRGGNNFSWSEGISMRSLDNTFITPTLRNEGLLNVNKDGCFMTRSLAENYPYSQFYKAAIRGARAHWLAIVEELETGTMSPLPALRYLLAQLLNRAAQFEVLATQTLDTLSKIQQAGKLCDRTQVEAIVLRHMSDSGYAARLMEIAMHALMQAVQQTGGLGAASLIPLSQMRNANKKHGNIGDIELQEGKLIVESWDAKYGKSYLRDELEELNDKLGSHPSVAVAGFVSSGPPDLTEEIAQRAAEIQEINDTTIRILALDEWTREQFERAAQEGIEGRREEKIVAENWLLAYAESLAQRRLNIAPIDEPCYAWLNGLHELLLQV